MQFVRTEEQGMLARSAQELVDGLAPLARVRGLRAGPSRFDPALWQQIVEMGWTAIPFDEEDGGLGLGLAEVIVVMEALGRNLAASPLLSTVGLAGPILAAAPVSPARDEWLGPVIEGETIVSLAWEEAGSRGFVERIHTTATPDPSGFTLQGEKTGVLDAPDAAAFIVTAKIPGDEGLTAFWVPREAPGLDVLALKRLDGRSAGVVQLGDISVSKEQIVGDIGGATAIVETALDRATVALCAEMVGSMSRALDVTVRYLKERHQFGRPIGSFQGLQHRAADLFIAVELARTSVVAAAATADTTPDDLPLQASLAKAHCSEAFLKVAHEAVQMHGGIGMTDEHDIGFFLKRARVCEQLLRDPLWHRDRWARLHGY